MQWIGATLRITPSMCRHRVDTYRHDYIKLGLWRPFKGISTLEPQLFCILFVSIFQIPSI